MKNPYASKKNPETYLEKSLVSYNHMCFIIIKTKDK